jgi:hypothetical protein
MAAARVCLKSAVAGAAAALGVVGVGVATVDAHCQVPCGIYDDDGRIKRLREDVTTITKVRCVANRCYVGGVVHERLCLPAIASWAGSRLPRCVPVVQRVRL